MYDESTLTHELRIADIAHGGRDRWQFRASQEQGRVPAPRSYRARLGRECVQLDTIPFRILSFLAATPYRAYSRRRIAQAVSSRRYPVAEETLDEHIRSLRNQLGFFRDYIQAVPYIGYRFKA